MKALVVLYYWPPSGGPGVQRGVKLCRDLREEGVEPVVVTVTPDAYALPGEYPPDPTLAAEVPADLRVVRTPHGHRTALRGTLTSLHALRAAQHLAPSLFFERQAGWLGPLTSALGRAVRDVRPDVLLTSSQPYVVHLAGRAARLATGVPWVADFRDPWTFSWGRSWASRRAFAWEAQREEEVLGDADAVLANTPGTRREWLERRPWLDPRKVHVVRNGYDPADFRVPAAPRRDGEVRIVHAGSFRARPPGRERGGIRARLDRAGPQPIPYDDATHSPEPLFRAMAAVRDGARRLVLRLVGAVDPRWGAVAEDLGVADRVEAAGYLPHRASVAELLAADLLWLPTITRRDGGPVANVPAKTYEYLGSGRPILAYAGPGDVADLMTGRARCTVVAPGPSATGAIAEHLAALVAGGAAPAESPDPEDARPFRRRETAHGVAEALRHAVARRAARASAPAGTSVPAPAPAARVDATEEPA